MKNYSQTLPASCLLFGEKTCKSNLQCRASSDDSASEEGNGLVMVQNLPLSLECQFSISKASYTGRLARLSGPR